MIVVLLLVEGLLITVLFLLPLRVGEPVVGITTTYLVSRASLLVVL